MPIEGIDKKYLEELAAAGEMVTVPAALLLMLVEKIERLEEEIAELKRNSTTSSKPPSSDRNNPNKPDKDKKKGGRGRGRKRKPGGQKGHRGETLRRVANPDHTIEHELPDRCPGCAGSLRDTRPSGHESRQVFDLPEEISIEVTEHRAHTCQCPGCGKKVKGSFPGDVLAPVQYGERAKALAIYLHTYQLLPCERLGELFGDLFGHRIGAGTVSKFLEQGGARAAPLVEAIKRAIREGPFIHSDETGLSVSGKLHWLHTAATSDLTYLHVNEKRGYGALVEMGVLTGYTGFAVHDYFAGYYKIGSLKHSLCNAHHLRDLDCVAEGPGQCWAAEMRELLLSGKIHREREEARGRRMSDGFFGRLEARYHEILDRGYARNPEPERRPGQRGRTRRGKALNLLDRFRERCEEVLAYLIYDMPFDNNQAERDLRMMKTKQKISGCFRNQVHAKAFAKLRSVIATAKKRSLNVLEIIKLTLKDPAAAQACLLGT